MSESNPFDGDSERTLPFALAGELAEYRDSARRAAMRVTVKELAFDLNLDPESVHNQLRDWNQRKKPSADAAYLLLKRDATHRDEVVARFGLVLTRAPKLKPEETLRTIAERASKGFVSAEEIGRLMAQTDFRGER